MTTSPVLLVTGAAAGMGLAIAHLGATQGYRVAMIDRAEEALRQAAAGVGDPYVADLADHQALPALVERIETECGPIAGLVNNAGIVKTQPFASATVDDWERIFAVNARAPFLLMQLIGARMAERGRGAIVNISSVAGRSGRPEQTLYGASKAALLHLTKSAALALGPAGVRVNAVCPGVIDTEMTRTIQRDRKPADVERILRSIPLGRIAPPDEVASVVIWLLGDGAAYVNGQAINVCGGLEMD